LPVDLEVAAPLPQDAALGLTVYRVVQESLTNALRYAPNATRVHVRISEDQPGELAVTVTDNGGGPGPEAPQWDGSGGGLVGMRQRAAVYGGRLEAGPTDSGWSVRATFRTEEDD
jgi:signal transduction histidine kinase